MKIPLHTGHITSTIVIFLYIFIVPSFKHVAIFSAKLVTSKTRIKNLTRARNEILKGETLNDTVVRQRIKLSALFLRAGIFTAVTMKYAVFWNVTPCGSCKNRCFGGTYRLHHQGDKNRRAGNVSSN
jgi:hypothetical protein